MNRVFSFSSLISAVLLDACEKLTSDDHALNLGKSGFHNKFYLMKAQILGKL